MASGKLNVAALSPVNDTALANPRRRWKYEPMRTTCEFRSRPRARPMAVKLGYNMWKESARARASIAPAWRVAPNRQIERTLNLRDVGKHNGKLEIKVQYKNGSS